MSPDEKISLLREMLGTMMEWARQLPDQYLDSDREVRANFVEDLKKSRDALKQTAK